MTATAPLGVGRTSKQLQVTSNKGNHPANLGIDWALPRGLADFLVTSAELLEDPLPAGGPPRPLSHQEKLEE